MTNGAHGTRSTKNQRREEARANAKALRETRAKQDKRRKVLIQGGVIVGILAVVAIVVSVILTNLPQPGPRPANMASDGIVLTADLNAKGAPTGKIVAVTNAALAPGAAPVATTPVAGKLNIVEYQDYMCPVCGGFDRNDSSVIIDRVRKGEATYEVHPISILNPNSQGTMYSTRAANAAACVASYSPNDFLPYNQTLYQNQPQEGTTGLTDDQLINYAAQVVTSNQTAVSTCIKEKTYSGWVSEATKRVLDAKSLPNSNNVAFSGTPTVIVNGVQYNAKFVTKGNDPYYTSPADFEAFLLEQKGKMVGAATTSTPTP